MKHYADPKFLHLITPCVDRLEVEATSNFIDESSTQRMALIAAAVPRKNQKLYAASYSQMGAFIAEMRKCIQVK
jgi:hypothetical protein